MQAIKFRNDVARVAYNGATIEISRVFPKQVWGWDVEYFVAVNGDHYPYGVPYRTCGRALGVAKRRINRGDFETSDLFLKTGSFSLDDPSGWRVAELRAQRCQYAVTWRRDEGSQVWFRSTLSDWTPPLREISLVTGYEHTPQEGQTKTYEVPEWQRCRLEDM